MRTTLRKCWNYGQFDFCSDYSTKQTLIAAYGDWIQQHRDMGWDAYLFTLMFNELPGSQRSKLEQMNQEAIRMYGRLSTRLVRDPRSPKDAEKLPRVFFASDTAGTGKRKKPLRDVVQNDGLHLHGIGVCPRSPRLRDTLDTHFEENQHVYRTARLRHIHVALMMDVNPGSKGSYGPSDPQGSRYVTSYGMKGIKQPGFGLDDVLVLPRGVNDLCDRHSRSTYRRLRRLHSLHAD